ncbi:TPA: contact-dependent inhibition effector 16S rRNA endonuclease [Enterobacter cloacae]|uniref:contact-dependent inhibition effector 16S rRNA endonuclease n=1 Tax=Enterobacter cloacae complex TaxID=354276 RepID=UPI000FDC0081|nr:contact-dependent inhibition effector 16S rRNA endonuclease [Enterobacter cloacae]MCL8192493.1 contact-dependent inhibition effector 16S rRNA endonuclease [Enterobacter cloacae]MCM8140072.1 contact-dependent inhibition effector 16S rRNA endonuclease [Enterobacter cloacae]MDH1187773.1 contact-dependent inhibition effector 16S rRNA endonuclease [Enterobacter cloacae]HAS1729045.1 filamentous hemagglutinin N-terminal domain-containing protein [Enterobacter cloacae]HAV2100218.1 filamentous hemag
MMKQDQVRFSQRALSALLSVLLATQPLLPAVAASITPSGNTQMDKAANGVPVVNIATPNQSGISHNKYNDYNVGKEGLILNNATGQLNQTQLGGLIQNNPNLKAGQEAKGIINEVTGANRSNLQGYTEVAGKAANVIVANPYGITCNGCGFINTPNVTLTTGKPVLDASGKLQSLDVTQGAVTIEGAGLNGSQSDAVSIISRATEINAQLHAKDLRVVAGANRVAADGSVSALKGEGTAPKVAVDTGALGGMYANRIRLVSSETGVGVNLGNLNARQGDIALSSAGKVVLKNTLASGSTTVSAADVTLRGDHKAGGNVTVSGQTALTLDQAHVAADNNLQLTTRGTLTQNGGAFTAANDATLAATTLIQSADAQASAGRHLAVNAEKNAALNGSVVAGQQLLVKGGELVQQGNLSASEIALNAQTLTQESRSTTNASGNITLTTSGHSQLKGSTTAGQSLAVSAGSLANHGALAAVADTRINTGIFSNTGTVQGNSLTVSGTDITSSGALKSASTLDIRADNATLSGETGAKGKTTVTASGNLNNSGTLISDDTLTLNAAQIVNSGTLSGVRGLTTSGKTFTASATSVTHSGGDVALNNTDTTLAGETSAGGAVTVQGRSLNTTATAQTQGNSVGVAVQNAKLEGTQAAKGNMTLKADSSLNHTGKSSASGLKVETGHLSNGGTLTASSLAIDSPEVINGGLIHAGQTLSLVTRLLDNRSSGVLYSPSALSLSLSELNNAGIITSDAALSLSGSNLTNSGELSGTSLAIDYKTLKNSAEGMLLAQGANRITAQSVSSAGSMVGNTLTLNADRLESAGLLQGDSALSLTAGILNLLTGSRTLTGGALGLSGTTLTTAGQIQGQDVSIRSHDWTNRGSSLATGSLDVTTAGTLSNTGELMSQGNGTLNAVNTVNSGNMLSAGDLSLNGKTLRNSGTLQGNRVTAHEDTITNSGTLTGIAALTLAARLEMAAPLLTLVNDASGSLLTAGELSVTGGDLRNAGQWQGKRVLIHAQALTNGGAIQAENLLEAQIDSTLTGTTGSKITSNGELALSALTLANSGQWIAKRLTLGASTLNNSGEITGVDALSVALTQLNNQAGGKLLSAGVLTLDADNATNAGQTQGKATTVTAGQLINSGRLQGEALTLNASGALNNTASGVLLSENALTVSTATLNNQGTLQGGGESSVKATTRVQNDGKMLSGGKLTLTAPELANSSSGLVQAVRLLLDVVKAVNGGNVLATTRAELRGSSLDNSGTLQGADLQANYQSVTNSGTVLGTTSLTINGDALDNTESGKLYSGDKLLLDVRNYSGRGDVVSLGDTTLKLVNALVNTGTLAAGKTLSVSSQNAMTNSGVMQGNAIALSAGGAFTNNGTLTTGNGSSTFNAQSLLLNASGSLQAGGDVQLTSRENITVNGFTGTAGSLTMTAAGTLLNTALIYAGNNISLFAARIHNIYGDILADNSLWMQKNAVGEANAEVVNRSGTIETTRGDITVNTGHLLNEADGLTVSQSEREYPDAIPAADEHYFSYDLNGRRSDFVLLLEDWKNDGSKVVYDWYEQCLGSGANGSGQCRDRVDYRLTGEDIRQFLLSESVVSVSATGSSARIAAGRDITINAGTLDNRASHILAGRNAVLAGGTLNNLSAEGGRRVTYVQAEYRCEWFYRDCSDSKWEPLTQYPDGSWGWFDEDYGWYGWVPYILGERTTEFVADGGVYRSVISAGGNVSANFTSDISNTNVTANSGEFSNTIDAPTLNTLSPEAIGKGLNSESLAQGGSADIRFPEQLGNITDALKDISGGSSLSDQNGSSGNYPLPSGNNGYFVPSTDPDSPYLITVNPKLDELGNMDDSLFNGLYDLLGITPGATPRETNSAYTDRNQFLGSSYFLDRLGLNPDRDYRFLGDAAFDTRYVSNAILNQTGSRYINGIGSDLDQMRYLMDSAAEQQKTLGLKFGVALTAEQVAALDKSMLWWESATLNGQTVMIPKVYLSPKDVTVHSGSVISGNNVQLAGGNVINSGSTIAAQNGLSIDSSNSLSNLNAGLLSAGGGLNLSALGDINNIGSTISGKTVGLESVAGSINNITRAQQWNVDAGNVHFSGTDVGKTASITATDGLTMRAGQDINVTGANVSAGGSLGMAAGNDINITANEIATSEGRAGRNRATTETASVAHQGSTLSAGGDLTLQAGNDVNARAAAIAAEGDVGIQAGRDMNLLAEASMERSSSHAKKKTAIDESVRQQGTEIASGGNTVILAGRDVTTQAAGVTAQGDIGVAAGRDINLTTATESDYRYREQTKTSSGFLSKKTTHTIEEDSATREKGSLLSGDNVTVSAGNNLQVKGSAVAGDGDVALSAGNNVDIVAATNTDTAWRFKETKKSGLMGTGGIGFTIGSSKSTHDLREQGTTQSESFSTVGSTGGNVSITAGKQAHIGGADIIAQKDISLTGDSVVIEPGHDKRTRDEKFEQKSSGLTVALSGAAGSAVNNAVTTAQSAKQSSDSRLAALQGTQAALSGVQAGQAVALDQVKGDSDKRNNNTIGVSASIGSQSSKSSSHMESETTTGSSLSAGNNVTIKATGSDITVAGSQIKAGKDVTLDAARDVNLIASQDTQQTTGKNSSSGGSLGVGVGVGSGGAGISISANANSSKGHEKGNGVWQNETTVDAGNRVTINTGRDATIAGAQVSGETVVADIGRDLTIASTQDSDHYNSKQNSVSGGAGYTFGAGGFSGSINVSRDKMTSDYDSVQEQSGLFAGSGGFDVTVGNHTQLDGGVIASTATADKNRLDTGTLGFSDIHNQADFKTEHQGAGISSGGSIGKQFAGNMANALLAGGGNSGHAEGTTQAAVSEGTLIIRDKENQKQDVADLSRDAEHANGSISPIFDKEKEQQRLQEVQLIGEIGSQVVDIANTQGEINGLNAGRKELADKGITEPGADASDEVKAAYQNALRETGAYKTTTAKYGTGSDLQRGIKAATAALQGLAGSDLKAALAGASAPELAYRIGHDMGIDNNTAAKTIAHAILGGAVAALQGNSAAAGAAGAATGELAAKAIAGMLYPDVKDLSTLSEEQKQTVSALATISAGMAGGLAGDSTGSAVAGGQAGKNAAENNSLALVARGCAVAAPCRTKVAEQLLEIGAKAGIAGLAGAAVKDMADKMTSDELEHLVTLEMMGNDEIIAKYVSLLHDKYAPSHTGGNLLPETLPGHTGNNTGSVDTGPNHTGNTNRQNDSGSNNTGNTEGAPNTGGNTTITPIPNGPSKDDIAYLALKGKEAQEAASNLGFDRRIPPQKAPFNSHGQPVFYDGKNYITPDIDSHNVTNGWKMFNSKGKRIGTYDSGLNRIKD